MNYLVIRKEKMEEAIKKYGDSVVKKCLEIASGNHPAKVYESMSESIEKECFGVIFSEIVS